MSHAGMLFALGIVNCAIVVGLGAAAIAGHGWPPLWVTVALVVLAVIAFVLSAVERRAHRYEEWPE